jgi:hypothetical protein
MTTMVKEIYVALKAGNVPDEQAQAAAEAVAQLDIPNRDQLVTKSDIAELKTAMADMRAELIKWNVGAMIALTAIFGAIVKLL